MTHNNSHPTNYNLTQELTRTLLSLKADIKSKHF